MRRADRLFEIIQVFRRARGPLTADAIAAELETSKRTIYRDIAALIAQHVPIRGEAGIGYVLEGGFDLPTLMFTSDEIEAVVLGAQWVVAHADPALAHAAAGVLAKVKAVVPEGLRGAIDDPAVGTLPGPRERDDYTVDVARLRAWSQQGRKLAIRYVDDAGRASERTVWPFMVGFLTDVRVLMAWCELRQDFRMFRSDRLQAIEFLDECYPERRATLRRRWLATKAPFDTSPGSRPSDGRGVAAVLAADADSGSRVQLKAMKGQPMQEVLSQLPVLGFPDGPTFDQWLTAQPASAPGVWLKLAKKAAGVASISKQQALDVALCHGWIDGQAAKYDDAYFLTRFTPRRPRSNWSEVNRTRAQELIAEGRMTPAGIAQVEAAKGDGRWDAAYPPPSTATVPNDLREALDANPDAAPIFDTLTRPNRWAVLYGLATVKKAETRARKIAAVIAMLERGETSFK